MSVGNSVGANVGANVGASVGKNVGILGGGQLAQMLALAGIPLGLRFVFFDPTEDCCAAALGQHIKADFDDWSQLKIFAESVDIVTFEFENIPLAAIEYVRNIRPVYPEINALQAKQDRLVEKQLFQRLGIATPMFVDIKSRHDLDEAPDILGLPFVIKSRYGGYDGKGQWLVKSADQTADVWAQIDGLPCIAEQWIDFSREVSMVAVQNRHADKVFYDLAENQHNRGILHTTINRPGDPMAGKAQAIISQLMDELNYCGVMALELFQINGQLMANEFAPRVHNTGHWTIEGAGTSQFENHLRAILNLPLGDTGHNGQWVMLNLVGDLPDLTKISSMANSHLHDYRKQARPGRKLGHLTVRADPREGPDRLALRLKDSFEFLNH